MNGDALLQTVSRFFALMNEREVEYLLVGGVAMLHYVEGRNTEDIDLIVAVASLGALPEITIEHRDGHFACGRFDDLRVELLLTTNPLFALVQRRYATQHTFRERRIPCATVEGLILLKLYALPSLYRQGNFARVGLYENDLATLMHTYQPDLEPLFADLGSQLSPADLEEVRRITAELQQRIERFRRPWKQVRVSATPKSAPVSHPSVSQTTMRPKSR